MRPRNVEEFFDEQAASWPDLYVDDPGFRRRRSLLMSLIDAELAEIEPGIALDAGCGSAVFSAYLAKLGWIVEGVDDSAGMLDRAERYLEDRLGSQRPTVSLWKLPIEDIPFPAEMFDVELCFSTLEYVENDLAALHALARVLKAGGRLIITVPNRGSIVRIAERSLARLRRVLRYTTPPEAAYLHFQRHQYSPKDIDTLLGALGLVNRRRQFLSVGFSGPSWLVALFERGWWAGMYAAVYVKSAGT